MRRLALSLALVALACAGARTFAEDPAPETVRAQLYRVWWAEGSMDLVHGGGVWATEVFLPDSKVVGTFVPSVRDPDAAPAEGLRIPKDVHAYARPSDAPRNGFVGLRGKAPSPIREVRLPAALAKRIVELADLTRRQEAEQTKLGADAAGLDLPAAADRDGK